MKTCIVKTTLLLALILVSTHAFSQNKEERNVTEFSGISLGINADLYLTQGSPQKILIEASEDDLSDIETVVKDGMLRIQTDNSWKNMKNVKIWISTPDVNSISVSGSGDMVAETAIISDKLKIRVSGSGNITIKNLKAVEVTSSISGYGNIYLGGTAEELSLSISGSGSMKAEEMKVSEVDIKISGSGSCQIDATSKLDAGLSGSGRVTYYSNPQVDAKISGSGKVKKGEK